MRGPLKLLKEKLLSSSSESINLLQYVSYFRTTLSRACELASDNLGLFSEVYEGEVRYRRCRT